ncbi:MAG TPA: 6-phosphogluconolactonase [Rubrobacter sp.]|nr:6-phosphogluconolactonase [Rubrobacter sp.]
MNVEIYENPQQLAEAAARAFVEGAASAIAERGRFAVALAGGSTPEATHEVLARDHAGDVDWPNVHAFFGDERAVPPDHEDSNYRMAREALLDRVPVGSVHRMRGELPPDEAAASYEKDLEQFFGEVPPVLDLVMLGIGEDGHTASLFPETPALGITDRLAVANPVAKLDTTRLTLTVPVLNAAREVRFLVAGAGKAEALAEILDGGADPRQYPAKLIRPPGGPIWMIDRAAKFL